MGVLQLVVTVGYFLAVTAVHLVIPTVGGNYRRRPRLSVITSSICTKSTLVAVAGTMSL